MDGAVTNISKVNHLNVPTHNKQQSTREKVNHFPGEVKKIRSSSHTLDYFYSLEKK